MYKEDPMKKRSLVLPLLALTLLVGCGESNYHATPSMSSDTVSAPAGSATGLLVKSDGSEPTGGDYSRTTISGDFADYSYSFAANGETRKTKQEMLDYYESVQTLVNENGGYIDSVNNRYNGYVITPDDNYLSSNEIQYEATGNLNFTVEIPNDKITVVTDSLESFCSDNNFVVTTYNQKIVNYEGYQIVSSYDQDSYSGNNVITQSELETKLKYASLNVDISYRVRRSGFERFALGVRQSWNDFVEGIGVVILAFLVVAIGIIIFFVEAVIFYKIWIKMVYKHRKKRPEYYPAKHVVIDDNSHEAFNSSLSSNNQ
jgi:hypothetical protein